MPDDRNNEYNNKKVESALATVRGTFWTYLSHFSGRFIMFVCTIVLCRLLSSEDFGVAAYAIVTIGMLEFLSDLGIGSALIYCRNDPRTVNSGFWMGIVIALSLFGVAWVLAPVAALFFHDQRATFVIRILALTFPLTALANVHDSLLRKKLEFGRRTLPHVLHSLGKGIFSILFALLGFGAYSLVYGHLTGTAISVIAYWVAQSWRPSLQFSIRHARNLLSYGLGIISINAVAVVLTNIDYLFVGHYLGVVALGVYMLSFRIPEMLIKDMCGVVGKVVFPVFTKIKEDAQLLSQGFLVTLRYVTLFTIPAALGLALISRPFVLTLFSEKWAAAIPVIPAISLYTLARSLMFNAGDVYKAQGRLRLLNKLSLLHATMLVPSLWWAVAEFQTLTAVAWTQVIVAVIGVTIKVAVAGRILSIPFRSFVSAVEPAMIAGAVMSLAVFGNLHLVAQSAPWIQLTTSIIVGAIVYGASLWCFSREVIITAGNTVRMAFARKMTMQTASSGNRQAI